MQLLHKTLFFVMSIFNPPFLMSSSTHSRQVFLPLPLPLFPTIRFLHADTQSSFSFRSTCPNHLNLPPLTTSATSTIFKRFINSSLGILSLTLTPHILLAIALSVLTNLLVSSTFIGHVSLPYTSTLCTHNL